MRFEKEKQGGGRIFLTALLVTVLALLIGAAAVLAARPELRWMAGDLLHRMTVQVHLTPYEPAETVLLTPENADFNQALLLISEKYPLRGEPPVLIPYADTDLWMEEQTAEAFAALSRAVERETGEKLLILSAARTRSEQERLYREYPKQAARPGTGEHEAGLALDVCTAQHAGYAFLQSEAGQFVNAHCWEYGFIIRYPMLGEHRTGRNYEPWHLRYVGKPHAEILYKNSWTLEEYPEHLPVGRFFRTGGEEPCIIGRGIRPEAPAGTEAACSPDNTGAWLVTAKPAG